MPGREGLPSQDWGTFHGRSDSSAVVAQPLNRQVNTIAKRIPRNRTVRMQRRELLINLIKDEIAHLDRYL
jgi:hypothetical protein